MDERREYNRYPFESEVELSLNEGKYIQASGVNISENGILVNSSSPVEMYTRMLLVFALPFNGGTREITCEGTVIRVEPSTEGYSTAIFFTSIRKDDRDTLCDFIDFIRSSNR